MITTWMTIRFMMGPLSNWCWLCVVDPLTHAEVSIQSSSLNIISSCIYLNASVTVPKADWLHSIGKHNHLLSVKLSIWPLLSPSKDSFYCFISETN